MQGLKRRIVYVTAYEAIAIVAAGTGIALLTGSGVGHAGAMSVMASAVAMLWNLVFNIGFERWEAGRPPGRGFGRRALHALGFEGGLAVLLVPLMAWWLGIGLVEALILDAGLLAFFLVYTFAFNYGFDRIFGLPAAATAEGRA
jgi:uncharacterized membrane protein